MIARFRAAWSRGYRRRVRHIPIYEDASVIWSGWAWGPLEREQWYKDYQREEARRYWHQNMVDALANGTIKADLIRRADGMIIPT